MTNEEIDIVRCVIGNAIKFPPDNIDILKYDNPDPRASFMLDDYMGGFDLIITFENIPTISEVREDVKNLYLSAVEWEWEEATSI